MRMTSLSVKLAQRQIEHLREIKRTHGISMAASIRNLIKRDIYGIGGRSEIRRKDSKKSRASRSGPSGCPACVRELSAVFEERKRGMPG